MIKPALIALFLLIPIISCTQRNQPAANLRRDFHLPVIAQDSPGDTIYYMDAQYLGTGDFKLAGKHKFTDTLLLNINGLISETALDEDFLDEYSGPGQKDSLSTDGFQIIPDYNTSIYYQEPHNPGAFCYFPLYVVNETFSTKVFQGKDSHAFGIQEAIDTTGKWKQWRPIEARGFDFCGNGYFGLKVHPGEFVMLLVPKYKAEIKNGMRIRLAIGETLYISRSYEGTFSVKQFTIHKTLWYYRYLNDKKVRNPYRYFYGAIPKGYDSY